MLRYRIMESKNLKEDNMIKNSHCESEKITCHTERRIDLRVPCHPELVSGSQTLTPHPTLSHKGRGKVKVAFTLAEVLITLGIIGVVAAMTLPAVVQHYNNHVTEVRLKKFYSVMNQAIQRSIAENGEVEGWDYFNHDLMDEDGNIINQSDKNDVSFKKYLAPYLKITQQKEVMSDGKKVILYYLSDGSAFNYAYHENRDLIFYPKNPEKCIKQGYTQGSTCGFNFEFYPLSNHPNWKYLYRKGMEPALFQWNGDVNKLYSGTTYSCNSSNPAYCTAIIQHNGWKVPKDFPHKIRY